MGRTVSAAGIATPNPGDPDCFPLRLTTHPPNSRREAGCALPRPLARHLSPRSSVYPPRPPRSRWDLLLQSPRAPPAPHSVWHSHPHLPGRHRFGPAAPQPQLYSVLTRCTPLLHSALQETESRRRELLSQRLETAAASGKSRGF